MAPTLVERWLTDDYRAAEPGLTQVLIDMLRRTPDAGYSANCAALRDADYRPQVSAIAAPTLVISSTHDLAATPAQGKELAAAITGARYVELNTLPHLELGATGSLHPRGRRLPDGVTACSAGNTGPKAPTGATSDPTTNLAA